ncbi:MAG: acyl-CoA dehydrogenase family protein [Myxococcota bacterium]|jgi:hypothetical protein|nr:acyl-CoA dehydrogenase family protein [Myxococcota bacterium]
MPRLDEDQLLLAESAVPVLEAGAGPDRFRALRDSGQTLDATLWEQLVELGWPGIVFPEDRGGLGWGLPELVVVMEALGHRLAVTPMLSTVLAGILDPEAGSAEGRVVALAWEDGPLDRGLSVHAGAARVQGGVLTGEKRRVLDGMAAESFVVLGEQDGAPALFRVDAAHVRRAALDRIDSRDAADVHFDGVPAVPLAATVEDLAVALDQGAVALSAEMLGGAQAALDATVAYLKERVQFDVPIGSFQALQHRVVDGYIAVELARSAVHAAARDPSPGRVSLAKTRSNDAYAHVAREAIQLHGGIGMTDEHFIGFHLKRAQVASMTLGTSAWHRDRWGRLHGY